MKLKIYLTVITALLYSAKGYSQQDTLPALSDISTLTEADYMNVKLPPLEVLFENCKASPAVKFYDARRDEEARVLKSVKREWLNFIRFNGFYQYGKLNDYSIWSDANTPALDRYSNRSQSSYSAGATLALPLLEIYDRKNRITRQRHRIEAMEYESLRTQDEQQMKIIEAYTIAAQSIATLKSASEAATVATAQYKVTETEFINARVDAQTLSRQKNIQTQAIREYEQNRAALTGAILKLELLSKTRILNHRP